MCGGYEGILFRRVTNRKETSYLKIKGGGFIHAIRLENVDRSSCQSMLRVKNVIETYGLDSVSICSIASAFTLYCQFYTFHLFNFRIHVHIVLILREKILHDCILHRPRNINSICISVGGGDYHICSIHLCFPKCQYK